MKSINTQFTSIILIILFINIKPAFSQHSHDYSEDEVNDLIPVKTLEIEADFGTDNSSFEIDRKLITGNANTKWFNLPSLLFRYGIIRNVEVQAGTGYVGVKAKGKVNLRLNNKNLLNVNKSLSGLAPFNIGTKIGICAEKKVRPSIAFTASFTLPFIGIPAFRPDNLGADLSFNLYNKFSDYVDISYDVGTFWSGYNIDKYMSWHYYISPNINATEKLYFYTELGGYLEKHSSPLNLFNFGTGYEFNDYFSADLHIGSAFGYVNKFFFVGCTLTTTIPF